MINYALGNLPPVKRKLISRGQDGSRPAAAGLEQLQAGLHDESGAWQKCGIWAL